MWHSPKEKLKAGGRVEMLVKGGKQGKNVRGIWMNNKENVASETDHKMRENLCLTNWNGYDDGISERLRTYAWDRACSLHSLMSLMRLLYLENTNENSQNKTLNNFLYVVLCNVVFCHCYINFIVKSRSCIFVQPTLKTKSFLCFLQKTKKSLCFLLLYPQILISLHAH